MPDKGPHVSLRMTPEIYARVVALAKADNRSLNNMILTLLDQATRLETRARAYKDLKYQVFDAEGEEFIIRDLGGTTWPPERKR